VDDKTHRLARLRSEQPVRKPFTAERHIGPV
jgi:hypothetical protein